MGFSGYVPDQYTRQSRYGDAPKDLEPDKIYPQPNPFHNQLKPPVVVNALSLEEGIRPFDDFDQFFWCFVEPLWLLLSTQKRLFKTELKHPNVILLLTVLCLSFTKKKKKNLDQSFCFVWWAVQGKEENCCDSSASLLKPKEKEKKNAKKSKQNKKEQPNVRIFRSNKAVHPTKQNRRNSK